MATQTKQSTASNLEGATKRVRKLNDNIVERARRGGEESLEAYEGLLQSVADFAVYPEELDLHLRVGALKGDRVADLRPGLLAALAARVLVGTVGGARRAIRLGPW